mmetsp:Transcript_87608/g.228573  ORF Transcript_87608/g.228573 Transcript_87608/m.228573 type:complete len:258 (-) Transcript_87608:82-855(-)
MVCLQLPVRLRHASEVAGYAPAGGHRSSDLVQHAMVIGVLELSSNIHDRARVRAEGLLRPGRSSTGGRGGGGRPRLAPRGGEHLRQVQAVEARAGAPLLHLRALRAPDGPPLPLAGKLRRALQPEALLLDPLLCHGGRLQLRALPRAHGCAQLRRPHARVRRAHLHACARGGGVVHARRHPGAIPGAPLLADSQQPDDAGVLREQVEEAGCGDFAVQHRHCSQPESGPRRRPAEVAPAHRQAPWGRHVVRAGQLGAG